MKSLGDLLQKKQNKSALWRGVSAALIVEESNKVLKDFLGKDAANLAQAVYFKNKIITFACLSSVTAQEIRLGENEILFKINEKFGKNTVEKIRYLA
jgi:predicted nucleic acid-binding Zn ribbon protein